MSDTILTQGRVLPISFGPLKQADGNARHTGPCGDTMEFWVQLDHGEERIALASFTTDGCEDSIRCGAAMAALASGLPLARWGDLAPEDVLAVAGMVDADSAHCARLALDTLRLALKAALPEPECNNDCASCQDGACDQRLEAAPAPSPASTADKASAGPGPGPGPMSRIAHKLVVLSGKGGVGKSTVAVNLAARLALEGKRTGLLDIDLHGPSVPVMLGLQDATVSSNGLYLEPVVVPSLNNLKVFSLGFLLKKHDDAVIWRGPMKASAIKQFLNEVDWGELDYLVVDCPPGTGDEQLAIFQEMEHPEGAIIVTTPQEVAASDVRKSIMFCKQLKVPVLGIVENMSGYVCPSCGNYSDIFHQGGGEAMAQAYQVPFLGRLSIEPAIGRSCDEGQAFVARHADSPNAEVFGRMVNYLAYRQEYSQSKAAIPVANGVLNQHFGHCDQLAVFTIDSTTRRFKGPEYLVPPPHEPGLLPRWLDEQGIRLVIAGGMGQRAMELFQERGITVVCGAPCLAPEVLLQRYLDGSLETGANACDH